MNNATDYNKKSFGEKLGNVLARKRYRCLLFLIIFIVGLILIFNCGTSVFAYLGLLMFLVGCFGFMAIVEVTKTYFIGDVLVECDGEKIPCVIVRQDHFATLPIIFFLSIFHYFPSKKQHILIKNIAAPELSRYTRISDDILLFGLLQTEPITKCKAMALLNDPQIIADELSEEIDDLQGDALL